MNSYGSNANNNNKKSGVRLHSRFKCSGKTKGEQKVCLSVLILHISLNFENNIYSFSNSDTNFEYLLSYTLNYPSHN